MSAALLVPHVHVHAVPIPTPRRRLGHVHSCLAHGLALLPQPRHSLRACVVWAHTLSVSFRRRRPHLLLLPVLPLLPSVVVCCCPSICVHACLSDLPGFPTDSPLVRHWHNLRSASQPPSLPSIRPPPSEMRASSPGCCLPDRHRQPPQPCRLCRLRAGSAALTPWSALRRRPPPNLVGIQASVNAEQFQAVHGPLVLLSTFWLKLKFQRTLVPPSDIMSLGPWPPCAAHCRLITAFMRHGSTSDDSCPRGSWL